MKNIKKYWSVYTHGINTIKTDIEVVPARFPLLGGKPTYLTEKRMVSAGNGNMPFDEKGFLLVQREFGTHTIIITPDGLDLSKPSKWFIHFLHDSCDDDVPKFDLTFEGVDPTSFCSSQTFGVNTGSCSNTYLMPSVEMKGGKILDSRVLRITLMVWSMGGSSSDEIKIIGIGCEQGIQ